MAIAYGIMCTVTIALLVLYCSVIKKKEKWMLVLYASISVVELGYFILSMSRTVELALFANKLAYLGHIFLLISMYLTIVKLCGFEYRKSLPIALVAVGVAMLAMVWTAGYLPWYYKAVTLTVADGAAKLVKEYGPLHIVYLFYVLAMFALMVATIILGIRKKQVSSSKQAGLLTAVVLCNIAMWIIEKFVGLNFEFLSVSYILSEGMLFFLYWMMQDYVHRDELPVPEKTRVIVVDEASKTEKLERVLSHLPEGKVLTQRQLDVLEGLIDGNSRKEIAERLMISENTVKMHVANLYDSLGVSGKEEILALAYGK